MRVVILGAHPAGGHSMRRYSELVAEGVRQSGHEVAERRPTDVFSDRVSIPPVRKFLVYFEKFVLFPLALADLLYLKHDLVLIADHSDSIWSLFPRRRPVVVVCHDLFAVQAGLGLIEGVHIRRTGRAYQRLVVAGLRASDQLWAVSHATSASILNVLGSQSIVVHNPLDPRFQPNSVGVEVDGDPDAAVEKCNPKAPYLLLVSSSSWRKRRDAAVSAWSHLRAVPGNQDLRLRVIGPPLTAAELGVHSDSAKDICVVLSVDESTLRTSYQRAAATLVLSRFEGFGWPILESQTVGTPVLATDDVVFREVGGDAAVFVDPTALECQDWESVWAKLQDPDLIRRGRLNAKRFSWPAFVRTVAVALGNCDRR